MAEKTVYVYTEGLLEPLDREYFKNTLRFLPGVSSVGVIGKPAIPAPAGASLGYEVRFEPSKLTLEEIEKRLQERGFKVSAIQEVPKEAVNVPDRADALPNVTDVYAPVAPTTVREVLFRVAGLVTVNEVRRVRESLQGLGGVHGFFSMVAEAADEPWAGDTGLVDVQYDSTQVKEEQLKDLIEKVHGLKVTSWKHLPNNLNFPFPL